MSTVNVAVTFKKQSVPASPPPSGMVTYRLMKDGVEVGGTMRGIGDGGPSFANVADGTYTVISQAMSTAGTPLGAAVTSEPFTVVNTIEADVPDVLSVTIA